MGFLNHKEARTEEQRVLMERIEKDGVCPFCPDHFKKYHPKPILKETDHWFVTTNMSPYEGAEHHFLFVSKPAHAKSLSDLTPPAYADLLVCTQWIIDQYHIEGGSFFIRFGDTKYTGSSVEHLHAQLISGAPQSQSTEALRVKLGWKV